MPFNDWIGRKYSIGSISGYYRGREKARTRQKNVTGAKRVLFVSTSNTVVQQLATIRQLRYLADHGHKIDELLGHVRQ